MGKETHGSHCVGVCPVYIMKILNIIQCANLGGMEQSTLESMAALKGAGHEVQMISLHPAGGLKSLAEAKGIPLMSTHKYRMGGLGNIGWLLHSIKQYEPDRIWLTGHNFGSLVAARLSGVPSYLSIHFHHCERPMRFWKFFYALAKRTCSGIRFISRFIFEEVAPLFKDADNTICFPNIFRPPPKIIDSAQARNQLGLSSEAFVIGNAGWLIHRKAFDVFLQTAARVKKQIPDAVFLIAGDGPERSRLEKIAEELNLTDNVMFIGWQKDLGVFYSALDILLFNTRFDALGRTPVEALCYDVPVVASVTHGGLDEFIRHGQDGFLIDQHDPQALADEIGRLYNNPKSRLEYAQSGHDRVLEIGSPEKHLQHLNQFMELR